MLSVILGPLVNDGLILFPIILFIGLIIYELKNDPKPYLTLFGSLLLSILLFIISVIVLYPIGKFVGWILVEMYK